MRFVPVPLKYDFEEVLLAQFCTSDMYIKDYVEPLP